MMFEQGCATFDHKQPMPVWGLGMTELLQRKLCSYIIALQLVWNKWAVIIPSCINFRVTFVNEAASRLELLALGHLPFTSLFQVRFFVNGDTASRGLVRLTHLHLLEVRDPRFDVPRM
jgi:hypothetical protein